MDKYDFVAKTAMTLIWNNTEKQDAKRIASQTPDDGVTVVSDVPYINDGTRAHLLDVYYPDNAESLPVIIDIHGGGWMYGYKEINKHYCMHVAKRGYTVFSINYRLVPEVDFGGQVQDIMQAFKWIGEHLTDYPCDTKNVFLTGDSAGGHMAAYLPLINTSEKLRKMWDTVQSTLKFNAVCLTSPVAFPDDGGLYSFALCPIFGRHPETKPYAGKFNVDSVINEGKMPPVYIITSTGDILARKQSRKLFHLYQQQGIECMLHDFPKWNGKHLEHVFAVINPFNAPGNKAISEMTGFFGRYIVK